jgi:hypothetical protein
MTTKEKAEELVNKYLDIEDTYEYISYSMAKKCALITVDEILNWPQVLDTVRISKDVNEFNVRPSRYWTEVKEEINKL